MDAPARLAVAWSLTSSAYQVAQWLAARRFLRPRPAPPLPLPVTVLKPLYGLAGDVPANLETFCRQDHPDYQIVFGVETEADPAVPVVRALMRRFPERDMVLSVGAGDGTNRKVATLARMMSLARHDLLVLSDADVRVRPDYLRTLVAPLADPAVGLSTCLYRGRAIRGLAARLESLLIDTDFLPMVMLAQWVQPQRYALGASVALRRAALDAIGGFPALRDHLADDYLLGERIARAGWHLRLLPHVVETVIDTPTLRAMWRHQLRWARTNRVSRPVDWFATILVVHTMLAATVALLASGGAVTGWLVLALALGCRLGALRTILRLAGARDTLRRLWLVPAKDLLYSALWAASWLGRDVEWNGRRLRVLRDGRLELRAPAAPALAGRPVSSAP